MCCENHGLLGQQTGHEFRDSTSHHLQESCLRRLLDILSAGGKEDGGDCKYLDSQACVPSVRVLLTEEWWVRENMVRSAYVTGVLGKFFWDSESH